MSLSCKAQQEYPLNSNLFELPQNSYFKDLNNELNPYVGTYKASFNGKQITLYITKETKKYFDRISYKFYKDVLSVRYTVQNSSGQILQSTQNQNFTPDQVLHTIYSVVVTNNNVSFTYGGTNCSVGNGSIILKKLNNTQLSWSYYPNDMVFVGNQCPSNLDITIYLPETENLVFTKQ
ncbi:MAG: hypothetical protein DI598_17790 [Pseudopedobacter saltans]|uniref:DUF6705 domain-containing protein n=1 Tax=Pseudopedobacter saltans TaxID=151895 RepID=A0A2W5EIF1_9SPHI|nr:MAG: hypothetical protein DI598_17790 [Pseudopedobacter saltans]